MPMNAVARPIFRQIEARDVKELLHLRTQVKENVLTSEELERRGITESDVIRKLSGSFKGWLCECDGRIVGFAMGDRLTGEMWVIAVLPEYEGRGIGRRLLGLVEEWLFSFHDELWLTTEDNPNNRAYGVYLKAGWRKVSSEGGHCRMVSVKTPELRGGGA